jgi:hypothetical protein
MRQQGVLLSLLVCIYGLANLNANSAVPITQTAQIKTVIERAALGDPLSWSSGAADVLFVGSPGVPAHMQTVAVRNVYYRSPAVGIALTLLSDAATHTAYVIPGGQSFYVLRPSGVVSCLVGGGSVMVKESLFKMATATPDGVDILGRFVATVSDEQMLRTSRQPVRIDITPGVPNSFWTAHGGLDQQPGLPRFETIELVDDVLRLVLVGGGEQKATFWIDMAAKRLTRALVGEKEVFLLK